MGVLNIVLMEGWSLLIFLIFLVSHKIINFSNITRTTCSSLPFSCCAPVYTYFQIHFLESLHPTCVLALCWIDLQALRIYTLRVSQLWKPTIFSSDHPKPLYSSPKDSPHCLKNLMTVSSFLFPTRQVFFQPTLCVFPWQLSQKSLWWFHLCSCRQF